MSFIPDNQFVAAIGGVFLYSADPAALAAWYADNLGITAQFAQEGAMYGRAFQYKPLNEALGESAMVWSIQKMTPEMKRVGRTPVVVNYRIYDLHKLKEHLATKGIDLDVKHYEGEGYFAHLIDPDGNKLELWQDGFDHSAS